MRLLSPVIAVGFGLIFGHTRAQSLPYNPTRIFLSPKNPNLAYIFLPSASSSSHDQLVSLNVSTTIQESNLPLETLTSDLPFLGGQNAGQSTAYIPSISSSGSIGVYAGPCTNRSSFWIFTPSSDLASERVGIGNWKEESTTPSASLPTSALPNANFLASSFSFSTLVGSNDTQQTVYAFGGMCPTNTIYNSTAWQRSANYSNSMLKLSYSSPTSYGLSLSTSISDVPIPEAGFTFTALTPAFFNSSNGIVTQTQSFVLLGGHTSTAFLNMSQVALFLLPQESWSFQVIDPALEKGNTELAIKSTSTNMVSPDPRSGHTAVLSTDGSSLIVFGGWVGDVGTAAQPQLAILRTGSGFGGTGDWVWELPSSNGTGLPVGEGIYGHGAVMLPGNVMMVLGGYRIPASGSSRLSKKSDAPGPLFLNITSLTWSTSYTNPSYSALVASSLGNSSTSDLARKSRNVRLGVGLGFGLAALIGALCVYFWYTRRLKKRRREARDKDLQKLSRSAADYYASHEAHAGMSQREREDWWSASRNTEMTQREGLLPLSQSTTSLGNRGMGIGAGGGYGQAAYAPSGAYGGFDETIMRSMLARTNSNRSGASIPRKPVNTWNSRGYYQPAQGSSSNQSHSGFDLGTGHSRANSLGTAGIIHPIYEADEDLDARGPQPDPIGDIDVSQAVGSLETDPFVDPQPSPTHQQSAPSNPGGQAGTSSGDHGTHTPESAAKDREREIKNWVADWAAADALMNSRTQSITHSGRISPSKESASGRTESNLSEQSAVTASALGLSRNGSTRNNSLTAFFSGGPSNWNPFITFGTTPAGLGSITEHGNGDGSPVSDHASVHGHIHSGSNPPPSAGSATSSSFATAHTSQSLPALRVEGESLLPPPRDDAFESSGSPSKRKAAAFSRRQQRAGWLGSLKRVFIGTDDNNVSATGSRSARSSPTRSHRSPSLSNSPTRTDHGVVQGAGAQPRRTASASATVWRRKQGRDDWQDSAEPEERASTLLTLDGSWRSRIARGDGLHHGGHDAGVNPAAEEEEEWDIERAVERRVVQVMFTVPKEKLRVVNQDVSVNEDETSETGSIGHVRHADTVGEDKVPENPSASAPAPASPGPGVLVPVETPQRHGRAEQELDIVDADAERRSDSSRSSKGKGRVQEMVERLEGWKG